MKTSNSILLSLAIICLNFISCSKENTPIVETQNPVALRAINRDIDNPTAINPVNIGLEGFFKFDNNLVDQTGKLANAIPTSTGNLKFSFDRKGALSKAVYLDGTYGLDIAKVPVNTVSSIAVWIKDVNLVDGSPIVPNAGGLQISKLSNTYRGIFSSPTANIMVSSGTIPFGWHLVVVTYDGASLNMYFDGQLVKSTASVGTIAPGLVGYHLGQWWNGVRWKGYMDDLRFYNRALTAAEVQTLYNF